MLDDGVRNAVTIGQFGWSDTFETAGGPVYSTLFVAGMFTAGRLSHGTRFRAMTYDMLDAAIVNFAYTEVLKVAVGRERPNGQDNKSFPSGHTSNAFALASVAQAALRLEGRRPRVRAGGLHGRLADHQDKHWLSDVVAGRDPRLRRRPDRGAREQPGARARARGGVSWRVPDHHPPRTRFADVGRSQERNEATHATHAVVARGHSGRARSGRAQVQARATRLSRPSASPRPGAD